MSPATMRVPRAAAAIVAGLLAGACATTPPVEGGKAETVRAASPSPVDRPFRDEPWVYDDRPGRVVVTPHYRIYLTQTEPAFVGRAPAFLESALGHYRTVATGEASPLPAPDPAQPLTTYVFRARSEWERMTRQLLGERAGPFLRIQRGGYAWGGVAVLFDLDGGGASRDTLSLVAHEGWHQFTQATFRQPLPPWLEEGLATMCEGYRWTGGTPVALFEPLSNPERRARLARLVREERCRSVQSLVLDTPADLAADAGGGALDYYAQVWALAAYLTGGEGGRYAGSLSACVQDARSGELGETIVRVLGPARASALIDSTDHGRSLATLEAYFGRQPGGLAALEAGYRRYAGELAAGVAEP